MRPDYLIALAHLDEKTPQFFRDEIFSHGDTKVGIIAISILGDGLDPRRRSSRVLRRWLIDVRERGNAG